MRPLSIAKRNQTKDLLRQGKSTREVEKELGVSHGFVAKVSKEDKENIPTAKMGRPPKVSKRTRHLLATQYNTCVLQSLEDGHNFLNRVSEGPVHNTTLRRYLKQEGVNARIKQKASALTEIQRGRRLQFAKDHAHMDARAWKQVMFSDEKVFERFGSSGRQYYYSNAEHKQRHVQHFREKKQGGGGKIQVWGCITSHGVGDLEWVEGNMESVHYVEVLDRYVIPSRDWYGMDPRTFIFQHDNSSVHTARIVKDHLATKKITVLQWPVNSPDINPIERVWAYVMQRLDRYPRPPFNLNELFERVDDNWGKVPPIFLSKLYEELPDKMQMLIKTKGLHSRLKKGATDREHKVPKHQ
jgi:transposase